MLQVKYNMDNPNDSLNSIQHVLPNFTNVPANMKNQFNLQTEKVVYAFGRHDQKNVYKLKNDSPVGFSRRENYVPHRGLPQWI